MDIRKIAVSLILMAGMTSGVLAQEPEIQARNRVNELNATITEVDPSLSLTPKQDRVLYEIQLSRIYAIDSLKKSGLTENDLKRKIKEINKEYLKKLNGEVLTKEQRQAQRKMKNTRLEYEDY